MTEVVFYFFAVVAVVSALLCITQRNPVSSALWLVSTMFCLAAIFILLNAFFIGIIQVLVYAGAIMVLFLFVIMLLNLDHQTSDMRKAGWWLLAVIVFAVLVTQLVPLHSYSAERLTLEFTGTPEFADPDLVFPGGETGQQLTRSNGVVGAVAQPLFLHYLIPFEVTSILLLTAIIGAVVLAKRRL